VIVAVVAWGCFVGAIMAVVVNTGVVVDAVISADMTDVTVPSSPRTDVAGPYSVGIRRRASGHLFRQEARLRGRMFRRHGEPDVEGNGPHLPL
jgi:hypothetical protein